MAIVQPAFKCDTCACWSFKRARGCLQLSNAESQQHCSQQVRLNTAPVGSGEPDTL